MKKIVVKPAGSYVIVAGAKIVLSDQGIIWTQDDEIWMTEKTYAQYRIKT